MEKDPTENTTVPSSEISELKDRLERIEQLLNNDILHNCNKMSNHIDFIERIYQYIKYPLFYISDKMRFLSSKQSIPIEYESHQTQSTD